MTPVTLPKVVIFDLGKVLVDFDYAIAVRRIAARGRITPEELGRLISAAPLLLRYEMGFLTSEEFYREVCAATGYRGDLEEFSLAFGDIFVPIEPMVTLHSSVRQRGIPTFILSNTNDLAVRHIRRSYPFFNQFDGYILSYEHGVMKPEAKIYEVAEKVCGRSGAEILYIDDRPENIAPAADRGWQVILQESPDRTIAAVNQLGLLGDGDR
ncbi:MAG TPA: HAD family phosphatase [Candidatus Limnocylindrales bacterium]|nr:HAD family phosphatase [Candidatus Limnocylindrales bacterium]